MAAPLERLQAVHPLQPGGVTLPLGDSRDEPGDWEGRGDWRVVARSV